MTVKVSKNLNLTQKKCQHSEISNLVGTSKSNRTFEKMKHLNMYKTLKNKLI